MFLESSSFLLWHLGLNSQFYSLFPSSLIVFIVTLLPVVVLGVLVMIILQSIVYVVLDFELSLSELHLAFEFESCSNLCVEFKCLRIVFLHSVLHLKERSTVVVIQ